MIQNNVRALSAASEVSAAAGSVSSLATTPKPKKPNPIDVHVGSRIRTKRVSMGISQEKLGEAVGGITFQQIQKYEKGANRVGASRLQSIAKALGVPVAFFFEGAPGEVDATAVVGTPGQEFANSTIGIKLNGVMAKLPPALQKQVLSLANAIADLPQPQED